MPRPPPTHDPAPGQRTELLGLPLHAHDLDSLFAALDRMVTSGARHTVAYLNVHVVETALALPDVAEFLRGADLVYCDGNGVRLGAWMAGWRLPPRMTGADWIGAFADHAAARGYRVYWLGGRDGVAAAASRALKRRAPDLEVVGTHHGYLHGEDGEEASEAVLAELARAAPDVVLVGFGSPLQERWIAAHRDRIDAPVVWAIGATADFVAGAVPRGPALLHQHGLEWLSRLLVEPRRLWRRYLVGNTRFVGRMVQDRWRRRAR